MWIHLLNPMGHDFNLTRLRISLLLLPNNSIKNFQSEKSEIGSVKSVDGVRCTYYITVKSLVSPVERFRRISNTSDPFEREKVKVSVLFVFHGEGSTLATLVSGSRTCFGCFSRRSSCHRLGTSSWTLSYFFVCLYFPIVDFGFGFVGFSQGYWIYRLATDRRPQRGKFHWRNVE